jgi:hypothetical protein
MSDEQPTTVAEVSLTEHDLETTAVLYGSVKALYGTLNPEKDAGLTETFDQAVSNALRGLSARIARDVNPFERQADILATKYELSDICLAQLIEYAAGAAPGIAEVVSRVRELANATVSEFPRVCRDLVAWNGKEVATLRGALAKAQEECRAVLDAAETLEGEVASGDAEVRRLQCNCVHEEGRRRACYSV